MSTEHSSRDAGSTTARHGDQARGLWRSLVQRMETSASRKNAPFKQIHPFSWGLDHLGLEARRAAPLEALAQYTRYYTERSTEYLVPVRLDPDQYELRGVNLRFPSTVKTFDETNDQAVCRYFPRRGADSVVLAVPHWNGGGASYDRLCRFLNQLGFSAAWSSLPFHDSRGDGRRELGESRLPSTLMVSADIGLTLLCMRQAVQDVLSTVSWLELQGYRHIGVLGASIGSCVAFLAAAHDPRIEGLFANLMSSYFGEVVWNGLSTRHVRLSVEGYLSLEELRDAWLLNSPINYLGALRQNNPGLAHFVVSGRYDSTFPFYLTEQLITAYDRTGVRYSHRVLPCGHYTLGASPFKLIDGYYLWRFFRSLFSRGNHS